MPSNVRQRKGGAKPGAAGAPAKTHEGKREALLVDGDATAAADDGAATARLLRAAKAAASAEAPVAAAAADDDERPAGETGKGKEGSDDDVAAHDDASGGSERDDDTAAAGGGDDDAREGRRNDDNDGEEEEDDDDEDDDDDDDEDAGSPPDSDSDDDVVEAGTAMYRKYGGDRAFDAAAVIAGAPPEPDDCLLFTAALVGFLGAMAVGIALPPLGVPQELVMGSSMGLMLAYIVALNFCTCACFRREGEPAKRLAPVEMITPQMVGFFTACLGGMLGGMFGGTLRSIRHNGY